MARTAACCAVVVLSCFALLNSAAGDSADTESEFRGSSSARAKVLVEAVLQAGLAGDTAKRNELLAEAVAADGDYAPARWHSGQVKFNGLWQTPAKVGQLVSSLPRYREYRELARRLCRRHG